MTRNRARSRRSVIAWKNVVISSVVRYLGAPGVLFRFSTDLTEWQFFLGTVGSARFSPMFSSSVMWATAL